MHICFYDRYIHHDLCNSFYFTWDLCSLLPWLSSHLLNEKWKFCHKISTVLSADTILKTVFRITDLYALVNNSSYATLSFNRNLNEQRAKVSIVFSWTFADLIKRPGLTDRSVWSLCLFRSNFVFQGTAFHADKLFNKSFLFF